MNDGDTFSFPGGDFEAAAEVLRWLAEDRERRRAVMDYDAESGHLSGFVFTEVPVDE